MRRCLILSTLLFLAACTYGAMSPEEVTNVQANCTNVNQQIHTLEQEKVDNDYRAAAGVGNFVPMTAMFRFVTGRYDTNAKISTGEWAAMIDKKLVELHAIKQNCEM